MPLIDARLLRLARGQLSFPQRGAIERRRHKSLKPLSGPHTRSPRSPPPLFSDACMGPKSIKGLCLLNRAYLAVNMATEGAVSIRPWRQCVKVRFPLLAFRRLPDSDKPQITPDSFIISLPPLTPLARYFQPIHFYNLLLRGEQTRNQILEIPALCLSVRCTHKNHPGDSLFLFLLLFFFVLVRDIEVGRGREGGREHCYIADAT